MSSDAHRGVDEEADRQEGQQQVDADPVRLCVLPRGGERAR